MRSWLAALFERLASLGEAPDETADVRLRRALLVLTAAVISLLAFVWVGVYAILGLWLSAAIPFTYQVVSVIGLVHLWAAKQMAAFRLTQAVMILLLPFLLQWSLGGFVASSAVMIWAFWAPVGQLMYGGPEKSLPWFAAYLLLTGVSGFLDPWGVAGSNPAVSTKPSPHALSALSPTSQQAEKADAHRQEAVGAFVLSRWVGNCTAQTLDYRSRGDTVDPSPIGPEVGGGTSKHENRPCMYHLRQDTDSVQVRLR